MHAGITVRERRQSKPSTELWQGVDDLGVELDLMARLDKNLERRRGELGIMPMSGGETPQGLGTQPGDVMCALRDRGRKFAPRGDHVLETDLPRKLRVSGVQKSTHPRLGPLQHGHHGPEGVVEVEANGANGRGHP
jgi:hypothetical protein